MGRQRRRFTAQFKAKVALEAVRGDKTTAAGAGEDRGRMAAAFVADEQAVFAS